MTESGAITTIGFIGLGHMGGPMTRRLVDAGFAVQAYDVVEQARAAAVAAGATEAEVLGAAARGADAVILMLPNSQIVASVVGDPGLIAALAPGTLIIDMSSSEPMKTRELADSLARVGVPMIDAPVSGGVKGAETGKLTIMVGGSDEDVARAWPVFEALGKPVRAGSIGSGHAVKALNNLLSATHLLVTSEAIVAGRKFGLDPEVMLSIFNGSSGRSGSTENKWPNFILPETYNSGFGLRLMLKDMKIAVQLAEQAGAPGELGADAVAVWERAAADLPATADHTEIARWLAEKT
ncbi:NAD(P)-dependent oxidoreductase [Lacisediminihabitans profunda]|uniref:NAD(P)-dependent oxidoreductase n=1 Tax=Lacisediminihabitans profunda TaxID=2594790 RepID=A0A5C8UR72_9MICO|nr:NAD(P)-dependent oxidoreductase [Lacisediminihabitans profunda]TXN29957.1 NAD(P)-dependent oxidoreductase [Lacisediminihabitans profunda]